MNKLLRFIISFPKTLYYNVKLFGIKDGLKLRLFVAYNYKMLVSRGELLINSNKRFAVKFGLNTGSEVVAVVRKGLISTGGYTPV